MDDVSADQTGLTLSDEAFYGLYRTSPNELDLKIGENSILRLGKCPFRPLTSLLIALVAMDS